MSLEYYCNRDQSGLDLGESEFHRIKDPAIQKMMRTYFAEALAKVSDVCKLARRRNSFRISRL